VVLPPFSFVGTLPSEPTGGDIVINTDPDDGKQYRYHIFRTPGSHQLTWFNHSEEVEVFVVGGGVDGQTSSYTDPGRGGDGGEVTGHTEPTVSATYKIFTIRVGSNGEDSFINLPSGQVLSAGGSGHGEQSADPQTIPAGFAAALGQEKAGGDGGDNVGPVNATWFGQGGGGGFKLQEPYPQASYIRKWTTGGPYTYDCSYGARAERYQSGTTNITGAARPCNPCPPNAVLCHGPCDCNFAYLDHAGRAHWSGRGQTGCPGGWSVCGCNCCTSQPVYGTRYHCDSGGSLSGSTCRKSCTGDNTKHHQERVWTDCVRGMAPNGSRQCVDTREPGGGSGRQGVVVVRYEWPPPSTVQSTGLVGSKETPTIY